jgi:hypothetical protein
MVVFLPISASKDPAFLNFAKPHSKISRANSFRFRCFFLRRFLDFQVQSLIDLKTELFRLFGRGLPVLAIVVTKNTKCFLAIADILDYKDYRAIASAMRRIPSRL